MSAARFRVWSTKMGNLKIIAAPELKCLPPTSESFELHVYHAHYQAAIWRYALEPEPSLPPPTQVGWELDTTSNMLGPVTMPPDVSLAPLDVLQLIKCGCASDRACSNSRCGCYAAHVQCSIFCSCRGTVNCHNHVIAEQLWRKFRWRWLSNNIVILCTCIRTYRDNLMWASNIWNIVSLSSVEIT